FVTFGRRHARDPVLWVGAVATAFALVVTLTLAGMGKLPGSGDSPRGDGVRGPLRASGGKIVDARGREAVLTGVNWFGLETESFAPHGLWARNWAQMLDQMAGAGFNTLRLPYSNELFAPASKPTGVGSGRNPDPAGLTGA